MCETDPLLTRGSLRSAHPGLTIVHRVRLSCAGIPRQVEWYRNGVKLPTGHRFRTFHDFGIVILDILYCYAEDSGEYECRAVNRVGSDVTKATLRCGSKANLILTPQMPKVCRLFWSVWRTW